jgi:hypothetical protein
MKRYAWGILLGLLLTAPASAQVTSFQNRVRTLLRSRPDVAISDSLGTLFIVVVPHLPGESGAKLAPSARVFSALAAVYADLKVPIPVRDSANLIVGNEKFSLRGDLGGKSLGIYLECGSDVNGVWAEIYPISTSLISLLTPMPADSVELRTVLFATAVNIPKPIPTKDCRSTGELEKRLYRSLLKKLGK